jgi:hypothetical protein
VQYNRYQTQKGGTTTANLGGALAQLHGKCVLLVDTIHDYVR